MSLTHRHQQILFLVMPSQAFTAAAFSSCLLWSVPVRLGVGRQTHITRWRSTPEITSLQNQQRGIALAIPKTNVRLSWKTNV